MRQGFVREDVRELVTGSSRDASICFLNTLGSRGTERRNDEDGKECVLFCR